MIDKEKLISKIEEEIRLGEYWDEAYRMIDLQLLIDALTLLKDPDRIKVVRCKECRFGHYDYCFGKTRMVCGLTGSAAVGDGYCDEGVKRDATN